jgi:hypothetical protein
VSTKNPDTVLFPTSLGAGLAAVLNISANGNILKAIYAVLNHLEQRRLNTAAYTPGNAH